MASEPLAPAHRGPLDRMVLDVRLPVMAENHPPKARWAKFRSEMLESFPSPYRGTKDPLAEVIEQVIHLFEGLPNWGHPLTMSNVNPQANTAAIVAAVLSEIFAPDILVWCPASS